jgi:tetratricopeptide (TPR) repeat protein
VARLWEKDDELQEVALIFTHLAYVDFLKLDSLRMLYHVLRGLNLSEIGGSMSPARVWSLGSTSAMFGFIPNHALAEHYAEKALRASSEIEDVRAQLWTHLAVGTYKLGVAQWDASRASLLKVKELAASASDKRLEGNAEVVLAGLEYYRGGDFEICQKYYDNLFAQTRQSGDHLQLTWATYGICFLNLVRGEFEAAIENARNGESLDDTPINVAHLNSIRAMANWRLGNEGQAVQNCARALKILVTLPPQVYSLLMAYRMVAQVSFEAWEQGKTFNVPGWRTKSELAKTFSTLMRLFRKYEHTFPMGEPSLLYYQGCRKWLEGKHKAAFEDWEASARSAKRLAMPWDEANALREIGKRSGIETKRQYLQRALDLFTSSRATYDARETNHKVMN